MKELFTVQGFFHNRALVFTVSKISTNLYLADCDDAEVKRFVVKKKAGIWTSDNPLTETFSKRLGLMIEKVDNHKMQKIEDFVRSCFAPAEPEEQPKPPTIMIQNLARI